MSPKRSQRNKRKASPTQTSTSPTQINPAKVKAKTRDMTKDTADKIMEMLVSMKDDMQVQKNEFKEALQKSAQNTAELAKQISDSYVNLKNDMSQMVDGLKIEFKADIETLNNKIESTTNSFKQKVDEIHDTVGLLGSRLDSVEKDYNRISHLNELKFVGIPVGDNENLSDVFIKLASIIGYDTTNPINMPSLSRSIIRNRVTNELTPATTIIVKFIAVHMKEMFYSLYLRMLPNRKLSTKDLLFNTDTRIIIGENLTQLNHEIFLIASALKREKKIAQVFTSNGIVNVKLQRGGVTYEIRHKHNLEQLVGSTHNAEQTTAQSGHSDNNSEHTVEASSTPNAINTDGTVIQHAANTDNTTNSMETS